MFFPFHDDNPTTRRPLVTVGIIVANVISLVLVSRLSDREQQILYYRWGFVPARVVQLFDARSVPVMIREYARGQLPPGTGPVRRERLRLPPDRQQLLLSLVTCMFLHGGWLHLIGNMWFLWLFGNNVEDRLGHLPFILFYLMGGVAATAGHWLTAVGSTAPVVGASGAIAAVLGGYTITWPWARVRTLVFLFIFVTVIDLPALAVLGFWFVLQLLAGVQGSHGAVVAGVAWWAHVTGFVAGMLLMPLVADLFSEPPEPTRRRQDEAMSVGEEDR